MYETDIIAQKFFKKVTQKVLLENLRIVLIIRKRTHLGKWDGSLNLSILCHIEGELISRIAGVHHEKYAYRLGFGKKYL